MTRSANNLVTDSAAAGTAFACGANTNNGIIGYDEDIEICPTVLEGAKAKGYRTGLVTTTRITHATPAAFSSHVYDRNLESDVAVMQLGEYVLGPQVDLLWGGGRSFFTPASANGSRTDERDLVQEAKEKGWNVVLNKEEFDAYGKDGKVKRSRIGVRENWAQLPSLGLFADSHLDYEIDRDAGEQPSLAEMAIGALSALDADDEPFFLMVRPSLIPNCPLPLSVIERKADIQVEAGRIDHAGHANDAAGIIHDVLAYNEVWTETVKWIDSHGKNKNNYIVLATADHDTGALNLPGGWLPASLVNVTNSVEYLADWLEEKSEGVTGDELSILIEGVLVDKLALNITATDPEHMSLLTEAVSTGTGIAGNLTELRNLESGLNWGTGGHSSVDVSLYLYPQTDKELVDSVQGLHPNIWLGQWIEGYLGLDLASVKAKLDSDGLLRNETRREEILSGPVISE